MDEYKFSVSEGAAAAKNLSKLFRNMQMIGVVLEGIGNVESYSKEADRVAAEKEVTLDKLNAQLGHAEGLLDEAKAGLVKAKTEASKVVRDAITEAEQIIEESEAKIAESEAAAETAANVSRDTFAEKKEVLEAEIATLKETKEFVENDVTRVQGELDDLYERLKGG